MMLFDPLTAGTLLILAAGTDNLCRMPKPTEITVTPSSKKLRYDYSQSLDDLRGVQADTIDPNSFSGISVLQGYMKGSIRLVPHVRLAYQTFPKYGAACVYYESIKITIEIDPTIVIAKEVKADPCMHKAVAAHEMKHVMVDRKIVNRYSNIMGREVYGALKERGFMAGPVQQEYLQQIMERMQKTVDQVVEHQYKKMELEQLEAQRAVDSRQEYERVAAVCPDFNPVRNMQRERKR